MCPMSIEPAAGCLCAATAPAADGLCHSPALPGRLGGVRLLRRPLLGPGCLPPAPVPGVQSLPAGVQLGALLLRLPDPPAAAAQEQSPHGHRQPLRRAAQGGTPG